MVLTIPNTAHKKERQKTFLLIGEYCSPILGYMINKMRGSLKAFYSGAFNRELVKSIHLLIWDVVKR
jgi:hypothetical protein